MLKNKLRPRGLRLRRRPVLPFDVNGVLYAVGDIHGRADLLNEMIDCIKQDASQSLRDQRGTVVFLGDYIDRGPQSYEVLQRLCTLRQLAGCRVVFLMGNHEKALLNFVADPVNSDSWLGWGGVQTLRSYGVDVARPGAPPRELMRCASGLRTEMGVHLKFLQQALRLKYQNGNVLCVHAAASPDYEIDEQPERALLWGSSKFMQQGGPEGYWVVHGHTISDEPDDRNGVMRIGVDTGAYETGLLTAARIDREGVSYIQVEE